VTKPKKNEFKATSVNYYFLFRADKFSFGSFRINFNSKNRLKVPQS
jgi:hypothetical protein